MSWGINPTLSHPDRKGNASENDSTNVNKSPEWNEPQIHIFSLEIRRSNAFQWIAIPLELLKKCKQCSGSLAFKPTAPGHSHQTCIYYYFRLTGAFVHRFISMHPHCLLPQSTILAGCLKQTKGPSFLLSAGWAFIFTWVAVGPFSEASHQPVLSGQDVVPVLLVVSVLEHIQQLRGREEGVEKDWRNSTKSVCRLRKASYHFSGEEEINFGMCWPFNIG